MDRVRQPAVQPSSPHEWHVVATHVFIVHRRSTTSVAHSCMYFCALHGAQRMRLRLACGRFYRCTDVCQRLLSQIFSGRLTCVLTASTFYNQSTELSPQAVAERLRSLQATAA